MGTATPTRRAALADRLGGRLRLSPTRRGDDRAGVRGDRRQAV